MWIALISWTKFLNASGVSDIPDKIAKARAVLESAQRELADNRFDSNLIDSGVPRKELLKWLQFEKKILAERAKTDWLQHGDDNNKFFHASGEVVIGSMEIEKEILDFYSHLVRESSPSIKGIDIKVLRNEKQLSSEDCRMLLQPVSDAEISNALKSLVDNKAPTVDGCMNFLHNRSYMPQSIAHC